MTFFILSRVGVIYQDEFLVFSYFFAKILLLLQVRSMKLMHFSSSLQIKTKQSNTI